MRDNVTEVIIGFGDEVIIPQRSIFPTYLRFDIEEIYNNSQRDFRHRSKSTCQSCGVSQRQLRVVQSKEGTISLFLILAVKSKNIRYEPFYIIDLFTSFTWVIYEIERNEYQIKYIFNLYRISPKNVYFFNQSKSQLFIKRHDLKFEKVLRHFFLVFLFAQFSRRQYQSAFLLEARIVNICGRRWLTLLSLETTTIEHMLLTISSNEILQPPRLVMRKRSTLMERIGGKSQGTRWQYRT